MSMSANVVCNNILRRAFDENIPVTPMKLQKLMYFVSCEYVKRTGQELFSESFAVWQYGPVLQAVYDEFKSFGGNPINKCATDVNGVPYAVDECTAPNLSFALNRVWAAFKALDGISLSKITHRDGSGWSNAYEEYRSLISLDDMKNDRTYEDFLNVGC